MDNINFYDVISKLANKKPFSNEEQKLNDLAIEKMKRCGLAPTAQYNFEIRSIRGKSGKDYEYKDLQFNNNNSLNQLLENSTIFLNCKADAYIPYLEPRSSIWGETVPLSVSAPLETKTIPHRISNSISLSKSYLSQQTKATEQYIIDALIQSLYEGIFSTLLTDEEDKTTASVMPLFNSANITTISSLDDVLTIQKNGDLMASDNVFICSPTAKVNLYKLGVIDNGMILDRPTIFSNLIKDGYFCYISLKHLALCIYDVIGVTVDPYSLAKDNKINIVVEAFADAQLLYYKLINVGKFEESEPTDNDTTEQTNDPEPTTENNGNEVTEPTE